MRTCIFQGCMTALSSIAHNGGDSLGITSLLRREKFAQLDRSIEEVPVISGNALRGILRDRGMMAMCKSLGYGVDDKGDVSGLTLAAFYFLFSGGALSSTGDGSINIEEARALAQTIPLVGVFGGAVGNAILRGKLKMGKAIPICAETNHLLPESFQSDKAESIWEYTQREMYTRTDDEKNEHLRGLIAPETRGLLDGATPMLAKSQSQQEHKQQMRYYVETLIAGTQLYWQIALDDVTDIEFEAFITCLVEFSKLPYIGGKSAVGLGEVSIKFDKWFEIDSRVNSTGKEIALPIGTAYNNHLKDRGDEIRSILARMK